MEEPEEEPEEEDDQEEADDDEEDDDDGDDDKEEEDQEEEEAEEKPKGFKRKRAAAKKAASKPKAKGKAKAKAKAKGKGRPKAGKLNLFYHRRVIFLEYINFIYLRRPRLTQSINVSFIISRHSSNYYYITPCLGRLAAKRRKACWTSWMNSWTSDAHGLVMPGSFDTTNRFETQKQTLNLCSSDNIKTTWNLKDDGRSFRGRGWQVWAPVRMLWILAVLNLRHGGWWKSQPPNLWDPNRI